LVTGTAGTGKSSMGASFVDAACKRGESAMYFAFEESPQQIIRDMRSVGIDLNRWVKKGLLQIDAARPSTFGLEMHLVRMHHQLAKNNPKVVVVDPISGLLRGGSQHDVNALVLRVVDFLRQRGITGFFTALNADDDLQSTSINISSLVDSWILLRNIEVNGERNRLLYVLKSRGMAHSNQVREFLLTPKGVQLLEVYLGPAGVLTGSARVAREAQDRREEARLQQDIRKREIAAQVAVRSLEAKIAALEAEREAYHRELSSVEMEAEARKTAILHDREELSRSRNQLVETPLKGVRPASRNGKP
jgi:circadian clock protein KaiC